MFKGYCYFEDGTHTKPVTLESGADAVRYCELQKLIQHEVKIMDEEDYCVLHAIKGKIVFPECMKNEKE